MALLVPEEFVSEMPMYVLQTWAVELAGPLQPPFGVPAVPEPATPVPPSWPVGDAYLRQSEAALPTVRYSDIFRDARLQQLITQALANNRDLRVAAANIASTRAQYRI